MLVEPVLPTQPPNTKLERALVRIRQKLCDDCVVYIS